VSANQNASDASNTDAAIVPLTENQAAGAGPVFAPYIGTLTTSRRDMEGLLLPEGTQVLLNWLDTETFIENTEPNRKAFEHNDFAWTAAVRQKAWLPPVVPVALGPVLDAIRSDKSTFHAALGRNLQDAKQTPFPEFGQPFWLRLRPWASKITAVEQVGDLTACASEATRKKCGVPEGVEWSRQWIDALEGISEVTIFELKTSGAVIHVVAGFITQMAFSRGDLPAPAPVTQEVANALHSEYRSWLGKSGRSKPAYTYLTLASPCQWPDGVVGVHGGDHLTIYSWRPEGADDWTVRMPEHATAPPGVCSFLDRLRPETKDDFTGKLRAMIDEELYDGNPVHVKWLYETLDREYGRLSIEQTLLDLQDTGDYQLYWTRSKQLAIANLALTKPADVPGPRITAATLKPKGLFGLFGGKGSRS